MTVLLCKFTLSPLWNCLRGNCGIRMLPAVKHTKNGWLVRRPTQPMVQFATELVTPLLPYSVPLLFPTHLTCLTLPITVRLRLRDECRPQYSLGRLCVAGLFLKPRQQPMLTGVDLLQPVITLLLTTM